MKVVWWNKATCSSPWHEDKGLKCHGRDHSRYNNLLVHSQKSPRSGFHDPGDIPKGLLQVTPRDDKADCSWLDRSVCTIIQIRSQPVGRGLWKGYVFRKKITSFLMKLPRRSKQALVPQNQSRIGSGLDPSKGFGYGPYLGGSSLAFG